MGEASLSTGSPDHIERTQRMVRKVEEQLEDQGGIKAEGWREVEKEERTREEREGQEEVVTEIKRMAKERRCANTEGSRFTTTRNHITVQPSALCITSRFYPLFRDCSVPNLSTTRPIQKSLSRQNSQYSEDMDNLMNTKLVSGSTPPSDGRPNPVANHTVGFGSALHLTNSGTHGSLVMLDSYGNIGHHRANSVIRLPHPDYTAVDMPIFPSTNAILQGKELKGTCVFFY